MESDRGAALIIQAAVKGVIDFSKANTSDRLWWHKLKWILNGIENENINKIQELKFHLNASVLSYKDEEKQFEHHWEKANEHITYLYNGLFTWNKQAIEKKNVQKMHEALVNEWKRRFGDPNDPKVAAAIKLTVDNLKAANQPKTKRRR